MLQGTRQGSRARGSNISRADSKRAAVWSLQVAEGVLTVLLDRFMWIDASDTDAVAQLATSLVAKAASSQAGFKSQHVESASRIVRACAKYVQKHKGQEGVQWRESGAVWSEHGGVQEAVMNTGRVAAHALAAAPQRMVPLQAYAAVASFAAAATGNGAGVAADVSLRSWATGPAACAVLRDVGSSAAAATSGSTAAADLRAAALLLNSSISAGPALRTAAAAACASLASTAPLGALAGLANALRYSGFTKQRDCEELTLACTTLERELILRYEHILLL